MCFGTESDRAHAGAGCESGEWAAHLCSAEHDATLHSKQCVYVLSR